MLRASRLLVTSAGRAIAKPRSMPKRSARLASANGGQAVPHGASAQAGMPSQAITQPEQSASLRGQEALLSAAAGKPCMPATHLRRSDALHTPSAPLTTVEVVQQPEQSCSEGSAGPLATDPASSTNCYVGPGHGRVCAWCGLTGGQTLAPHDLPLQCDEQPLCGGDSSAK